MKRISVGGGALAVALMAVGCGGESSSEPGTGGAGTAATGGGSSGGASSGGASSGGSPGAGGGAGTSGAGGYQNVVGECKADADCELVDNCCDCLAGPKGKVSPSPCDAAACAESRCGSMQIQQARCIAGQCTIAAECDLDKAACDSLPPTCPAGQVPTVAGACWGPCVAPSACAKVESCFECQGAACVVNDAFESSHHCVNPPSGCTGCGCLGTLACVEPFNACTDGIKDGSGVHCSCPAC